MLFMRLKHRIIRLGGIGVIVFSMLITIFSNIIVFIRWNLYIYFYFLVDFYIKLCIMILSFSKEIFVKGGANLMTSYELIWRLIVLLILSNKNNENQDTIKE